VSFVFDRRRVVHHALFRPRQTLCLEDYACMVSGSRAFERLRAERLAGRHHRKHDPRELVGRRHRDQPRWLLPEKPGEPIVQGALALARDAQHRCRAQHEQLSDVLVALLGDRAELFLAAAGVLPRGEPEPSGEAARGFEHQWGRAWGGAKNLSLASPHSSPENAMQNFAKFIGYFAARRLRISPQNLSFREKAILIHRRSLAVKVRADTKA
jgi:hypothetical protein